MRIQILLLKVLHFLDLVSEVESSCLIILLYAQTLKQVVLNAALVCRSSKLRFKMPGKPEVFSFYNSRNTLWSVCPGTKVSISTPSCSIVEASKTYHFMLLVKISTQTTILPPASVFSSSRFITADKTNGNIDCMVC